METRIISH